MNQRDLELLSSYLDGQLKSSDYARMEAPLSTDPNLRPVLNDLRSARGLLRQLPLRKAPRNFTLTPKMVGKNPPLPRTYPVFRLAATLATILLFFTFGLNFMGSQLASQQYAFGMGGGGGAPEVQSSSLATEPPAAAAAPAATEAPAQEPSIGMAPLLTATAPAEDTARTLMNPASKEAGTEDAAGNTLAQQP